MKSSEGKGIKQPCNNFKPNSISEGYETTKYPHQCPICGGWRGFCLNCNKDHHENGWNSCKSQTEGKKDYSKKFENMLGNPIEQINGLITEAHTLSAKQKFIDRFGEDPVDVLGNDWENYVEDYKEMVADEELLIDK